MVEFINKKIVLDPVYCQGTGEVLKDKQTLTIKTRADIPFPSLLDTKGVFLDHENPNMPSDVNTADYVPLPTLVNRILRTASPNDLLNLIGDSSEYDEDDEFIAVEDQIEQMEELEELNDLQNSELSANAVSEHSAGSSDDAGNGDGAKSEAVSDGVAE